jgi:hypothetical protein
VATATILGVTEKIVSFSRTLYKTVPGSFPRDKLFVFFFLGVAKINHQRKPSKVHKNHHQNGWFNTNSQAQGVTSNEPWSKHRCQA